MFHLFKKAYDFSLDILFPPICVNCKKPLDKNENSICKKCLSKIQLNNTLFCPVCRARLPENKKICHFDCHYLLGAAGNYDDLILQNLIQSFKYKNLKTLAPILTDLLIQFIRNSDLALPADRQRIRNFIVVPIPLYPRRERERGFNQAKLITKNLVEKLNLEFCDALVRLKNTKSQAQARDTEERAKNVKDCFKIIHPELVKEKNIILVDDVFTSGATINEAVKILKQNGAKKILALVIAKA
ncbi:hypothetical protein COS59_00930 [Candidatus Wolfebacteria bacterium CG03_land_8_20_14_0_80_36_15]|uniref:Phosphoribosyltransferase domain-containing protein n=1 Tax=Candidatus Wolfebacteria bacterium CG03_land_8_20_14_0_80_36_15 TaxID=1975067 RepID=A0A2M7B7Z9_9BACT|nr:MAG: hypothetical protein COS59_00930 [Candidatus Wolfebacteria bacterium CG03_land_8_20_14_0_80_36_15]